MKKITRDGKDGLEVKDDFGKTAFFSKEYIEELKEVKEEFLKFRSFNYLTLGENNE